ncbi:hypothetical protein HOY80DRAFT_1106782 [Tuber brumale]|nr:hypothetical protein HOY80DRAFT_1106782 [Tuber brumale]
MSSSSDSVFVERFTSSGLPAIPEKRHVDSASNSEEPNKRSRVTEGSVVRDSDKKVEASAGEIWQPVNLGGGRPSVVYGKHISIGPENRGAWWRCKSKGCLANIPCANTRDGRAIIINHLQEHCRAIRRCIPGLEHVQLASQNSIQPIPDRIKDLVKVGQDIRKRELENLTQITYAAAALRRNRERKLALAAQSVARKEAEGGSGAQAKDSEKKSNNVVEKGKGEGKQ